MKKKAAILSAFIATVWTITIARFVACPGTFDQRVLFVVTSFLLPSRMVLASDIEILEAVSQ